MPFEEDVVLPAAHAQQGFAQQRDMMPVFSIDRDLGGGAERDLITGDVIRAKTITGRSGAGTT